MPKYEPNTPYLMDRHMTRHLDTLIEKLTPDEIQDDATARHLAEQIAAPLLDALAVEVANRLQSFKPRPPRVVPPYLPDPANERPVITAPKPLVVDPPVDDEDNAVRLPGE